MKYRQFVFVALGVLTISGCQSAANNNGALPTNEEQLVIVSDSTMAGAVKKMFEMRYKPVSNFILSAEHRFLHENRDEILNTLEVVEEVDRGFYGVVFVRYSVGVDIFREAIYLKKYGPEWMYTEDQYYYYSEYTDEGQDPFKDGKGSEAKTLIERVEKWVTDGATIEEVIARKAVY